MLTNQVTEEEMKALKDVCSGKVKRRESNVSDSKYSPVLSKMRKCPELIVTTPAEQDIRFQRSVSDNQGSSTVFLSDNMYRHKNNTCPDLNKIPMPDDRWMRRNQVSEAEMRSLKEVCEGKIDRRDSLVTDSKFDDILASLQSLAEDLENDFQTDEDDTGEDASETTVSKDDETTLSSISSQPNSYDAP